MRPKWLVTLSPKYTSGIKALNLNLWTKTFKDAMSSILWQLYQWSAFTDSILITYFRTFGSSSQKRNFISTLHVNISGFSWQLRFLPPMGAQCGSKRKYCPMSFANIRFYILTLLCLNLVAHLLSLKKSVRVLPHTHLSLPSWS